MKVYVGTEKQTQPLHLKTIKNANLLLEDYIDEKPRMYNSLYSLPFELNCLIPAIEYHGELHVLGPTKLNADSDLDTAHYAFDGKNWRCVGALPYNCLWDGYACVYNDEIHIFGGYYAPRYAHYKYNGSVWTKEPDTAGRLEADPVVFNSLIYTFVYTEDSKYYCYTYDGTTWTKSDMVVPYNLDDSLCVVYNNAIHLFGHWSVETVSKYHYKYQDGVWTKLSNLPTWFERGYVEVFNNKIYALAVRRDEEYYIYDGSIWSEAKSLPIDIHDGATVVYNNTLQLLGGNYNERLHYSFDGNNWSPFYGERMSLPYNCESGCAIEFNNEIHILGGDSNIFGLMHYKYNGIAWEYVSKLPYQLRNGGAIVYNNELHIFGGFSNYTKHYKYNGVNWEQVSTLPYRFDNGTVIIYNNEIHILGSSYKDRNYHYKWDGTVWTSVSTLPDDFGAGATFIWDNEIHIVGGYLGMYIDEENKYYKHYKFNGSSWIELEKLPYKFCNGAYIMYNDEFHLIGGNGEKSSRVQHYKYNGTGWTLLKDLPVEVLGSNAVIFNKEIHILGGILSGTSGMHYTLSKYLQDVLVKE